MLNTKKQRKAGNGSGDEANSRPLKLEWMLSVTNLIKRHCEHWHLLYTSAILYNSYTDIHKFKNYIVCSLFLTKGVIFSSEPQNLTVVEGESAHFDCVYEGSRLIPSWRINTTIYSHTMLPRGFEFNNQEFSLTVKNAAVSLNFTSFQCIVGTSVSRRGYLIVEKRITSCNGCLSSSSTMPEQTHSSIASAAEYITTGMHVVYLLIYLLSWHWCTISIHRWLYKHYIIWFGNVIPIWWTPW